jgi:nucleoside-diphosphate-sugar epimerase
MESKTIVLVGSTGILGSAIAKEFRQTEIWCVSRSETAEWIKGGEKTIAKSFSKLKPGSIIINAVGEVNPRKPLDELISVNSNLPKKFMKISNELDLKLITMGTILENTPEIGKINNYVMSKQEFLKTISQSNLSPNHLHLQLHTLYGGEKSHPTSLVRQICEAITQKKQLRMSSGFQIREYHHVIDEVQALKRFILSLEFGIVPLNAGMPIQIRRLAQAVFDKFNLSDYLVFDETLDSIDILQADYTKTPFLHDINFRNPIAGVQEYITSQLTSFQFQNNQ